MDRKLLDILVCPVTGAAVEQLADEALADLNSAIADGRLSYADGERVEQPLTTALRTVDGHTAYRVDDGIAVMLPERGIALDDGGAG